MVPFNVIVNSESVVGITLVILVQWLVFRLIISLAPGQQRILLLIYKFVQSSSVWCPAQFPVEPSCEDYTSQGKSVDNFEQGLGSVFLDPIETLQFLSHLMSLIQLFLKCLQGYFMQLAPFLIVVKLKLAPSIKLWCKVGTLILPISLAGKMSASKLISIFQSYSSFWNLGFDTTGKHCFECC